MRIDPQNIRKHSDRNKKAIRRSLEAVGAGRSILVDAEDIVRAGNGVYEQAQALGIPIKIVETDGKELVAVKRIDLTGKDAIRAAALDNIVADTSAYDYDGERLAELVRDDTLIAELAKEDAKIQELIRKANPKTEPQDPGELIDKASELQTKWNVQRGDVWEIGKHRLMCGDSTSAEDVARLMGGEMAAMLFTSPPYWTGQPYDARPKLEGALELMAGIAKSWAQVPRRRVVIQTGHTSTLNIGDGGKLEKIILPWYWQQAWKAQGWLLRNFRLWVKNGGGGLLSHVGPSSDIVDESCEWILTFWTGDNVGGAERVAPEWAMAGHWEIAGTGDDKSHPCPFPAELASRCIQLYSVADDIVCDPFIGSGTTLVACEQTGRVGRGMEIEPKYCAVALERLTALGLQATRNAG